jgi:hypothetical protein
MLHDNDARLADLYRRAASDLFIVCGTDLTLYSHANTGA